VVTVDYQRYFSEMFSAFSLKDYQWQWVVSNAGEIIYSNHEKRLQFTKIANIIEKLNGGTTDNIVHEVNIDGKLREIISSYYPTQLLQRDIGLVFSAPTDFFQKYIIRNSVIIVISTLLIVQIIILLFGHYLKSQRSDIKKLGSSEKLLFRLIEDMPAGIVIRKKDGTVLKANRIAAEFYSFKNEEEMEGRILKKPSSFDSYNYFSKNLGTSVETENFVVVNKDGKDRILYISTIPVVFMEEDAEMEFLTDVTLLESARKNEAAANAAKSDFLAMISYEIRTPLNNIVGMTDLLEKNDLDEDSKNIINHLKRSTEVLLSIINDILDFRRIESGKMNIEEIPFDLRDEIDSCVNHIKTLIEGDNIQIKESLDENVPRNIIGDRLRLRQILINLLSYSVGNSEEGTIHLNCKLQSNTDGLVTLNFELLDTGKTIDEESLKRISGGLKNFESRVAGNVDNNIFGVIIALHLIEMMGGELIITSPSGLEGEHGTKMTFSIVTYNNDRHVKKPEFPKIKTFSKIKALVITGNHYRDEILLGELHKLGISFTVTTFQKSTVSQLKANLDFPEGRYSLIIILNDEKFNGFEVAEEFRETGFSGKFAMMMVSSYDRRGNYLRGIRLGIDHYLVKPFIMNEIEGALYKSFPYVRKIAEKVAVDDINTGIKILIIEDNKMNQKVIGSMLKNLGFSYDLAGDGHEGYIHARTRKYDLIFMDLIMPGMDGFESAQKILDYDKSAFIVAFTADNMPDSRRKAELSGIKEFISKPVRTEDLRNLMVKYFSKKATDGKPGK
jgi:signal transduction histidine kinase/CheY-like chemotaxis protein